MEQQIAVIEQTADERGIVWLMRIMQGQEMVGYETFLTKEAAIGEAKRMFPPVEIQIQPDKF